MANLRVLHKAGRDIGKEADLSEKAQGLGVVGDGARQAEKAAIALEDGDPKAGQPEQVRHHQPDGAGADDRDVVFSHRRALRFVGICASSERLSRLRPKIHVAHIRQID